MALYLREVAVGNYSLISYGSTPYLFPLTARVAIRVCHSIAIAYLCLYLLWYSYYYFCFLINYRTESEKKINQIPIKFSYLVILFFVFTS